MVFRYVLLVLEGIGDGVTFQANPAQRLPPETLQLADLCNLVVSQVDCRQTIQHCHPRHINDEISVKHCHSQCHCRSQPKQIPEPTIADPQVEQAARQSQLVNMVEWASLDSQSLFFSEEEGEKVQVHVGIDRNRDDGLLGERVEGIEGQQVRLKINVIEHAQYRMNLRGTLLQRFKRYIVPPKPTEPLLVQADSVTKCTKSIKIQDLQHIAICASSSQLMLLGKQGDNLHGREEKWIELVISIVEGRSQPLLISFLDADQFARLAEGVQVKPKKLYMLDCRGTHKQMATALLNVQGIKERVIFMDKISPELIQTDSFKPIKHTKKELYSHSLLRKSYKRYTIPRHDKHYSLYQGLFNKDYTNLGIAQPVTVVFEKSEGLVLFVQYRQGVSVYNSIGSGLGFSEGRALWVFSGVVGAISDQQMKRWSWDISIQNVVALGDQKYVFRKVRALFKYPRVQSDGHNYQQQNKIRLAVFLYELLFGMPPTTHQSLQQKIKDRSIVIPKRGISLKTAGLLNRLFYGQNSIQYIRSSILCA